MIRWVMCVWCFAIAAAPVSLFAQFDPYGNRSDPSWSGVDPRLRRAYREMAVAAVGPIARDFVETQGDEAVVALFACSKPVAVKLAKFYASGELGKLPRPRDLLRVIAYPRYGDDVALWAMYHARELNDVDAFDAFLLSPLDYAMCLKRIEVGAAEARARRLNQGAMAPLAVAQLSEDEKLVVSGIAGLLVMVGFLWWRRKKSSIC